MYGHSHDTDIKSITVKLFQSWSIFGLRKGRWSEQNGQNYVIYSTSVVSTCTFLLVVEKEKNSEGNIIFM